jgi:antitoxin PrlF
MTFDTMKISKKEPVDLVDDEFLDSLMVRLFLDFALTDGLKNQELKPYTIEMSAVARVLTEGVEIDPEDEDKHS